MYNVILRPDELEFYEAEKGTINKYDIRKVNVFDVWCFSGFLRLSWIEQNTNTRVIGTIKSEWILLSSMIKATESYFVYISISWDMENGIMKTEEIWLNNSRNPE